MEYRESNMKRKIFLGIISILLFIFTGCGNQNAAHSTNNGAIDFRFYEFDKIFIAALIMYTLSKIHFV